MNSHAITTTAKPVEPTCLADAPAAELAADLNRIATDERQEIDRRKQERLAKLRGLARFDWEAEHRPARDQFTESNADDRSTADHCGGRLLDRLANVGRESTPTRGLIVARAGRQSVSSRRISTITRPRTFWPLTASAEL